MDKHQQLMTVLLVGTVLLAVTALLLGVYWLFRERHVRRLVAYAALAAEHGRDDEARELLRQAEARWSFNTTDGSRQADLRDLQTYTTLLTLAVRLGCPTTPDAPVTHLQRCVAALQQFIADRQNYRSDQRTMPLAAAARWATLVADFAAARAAFQPTLAPTAPAPALRAGTTP